MNLRSRQKNMTKLNLRPVIEIVQNVDICCDVKMYSNITEGMETLICQICGKFLKIQEEAGNRNFDGMERKKIPYGLRSGTAYKLKMKEEIRIFLQKVLDEYQIEEDQIMQIVKAYFTIRESRIPRANPRRGLICACINKIAGIPVDYLSKIYNLNQKYITEGEKAYRRELTPFDDLSIDELIDNIYIRFKLQDAPEVCTTKSIVTQIIKLSISYYIASDTTMKTKVSGTINFLIETGYFEYDIKKICKTLNIGIMTVYKFYDQLVLSLYYHVNENTKFRMEQMRDFLKFSGINISDTLKKKKRMEKYFNN